MGNKLLPILRRLAWLAALVAAIYSWLDFLGKPIERYSALVGAHTTNPMGSLLVELLNPFTTKIYPIAFQGWLFLLLTFIVVFALFQLSRTVSEYLRTSRVGVSVLETRLTLQIHDVLMQRATVHRDQVIHANRDDILAYHSSHTLTMPEATIDLKTFRYETFIGNELITRDVKTSGHDRALGVVELFKRPLPQSFFATYLPNVAVYWLYRGRLAFRRVIATRQSSMDFVGEYAGDAPEFEISTKHYPATNVVMEIDFPSETAPERKHITCMLVSDNIVDEVTPRRLTRRPGRCSYRIELSRLSSQQKLRFQWRNKRLRKYERTIP